MRSAFVIGNGVDFIHDDRFDVAQNRAALIRGQQNVERLWRGNEDVRRALEHGAPLGHERVATADRGANLRHEQAALAGHGENFSQRNFEVFLDVVAQCLQWRDVKDFSSISEIACQSLAHEAINAREECSQRFSGACRRGNQRGAAGENVRPALLLRLGWRGKALDKPLRYERVSPGKRCGRGLHFNIVAGEWSFVNCSLSLGRA